MGFGKDNKGVMIRHGGSGALGTLGASTALLIDLIDLDEDFRLLKSEIYAFIESQTVAEGPVALILASADLSVSEIAEAITVNGPLDRGERTEEEMATRPVWLLGMFDWTSQHIALNMGQVVEWKKRWTFSDKAGFGLYAMNMNSAAALSTGATVRTFGTHYGVWVQ